MTALVFICLALLLFADFEEKAPGALTLDSTRRVIFALGEESGERLIELARGGRCERFVADAAVLELVRRRVLELDEPQARSLRRRPPPLVEEIEPSTMRSQDFK